MANILHIRQIGDPILYQKSKKVIHFDKELEQIIEDMKETLHFSDGFGIAAPQIGINKRIIMIEVNKENCTYEHCEDVPNTVLINPKWEKCSNSMSTEYEGCLSIPEVRGMVKRYDEIKVMYQDERGNNKSMIVSGFTARNIQHECDHLNGILFLDRVVKKGYATKNMIQKFNLKEKK